MKVPPFPLPVYLNKISELPYRVVVKIKLIKIKCEGHQQQWQVHNKYCMRDCYYYYCIN